MQKILVVDDEPSIRLLIQTALSTFGYEVFLASNGAEALDVAKKNPVDLIITDVKMPIMDGHEFIKILKSSNELSNIPILLLTAVGVEPMTAAGLPDDYLFKPFRLSELQSKVGKWLSGKGK